MSGYLRHVDGLRGFSVLLVVLYHAWPDSVPGGFVGVDVFFVISGFLITRLLLAERDAERFSYGGFLLRRLRRLWPSFALVLAVVLGLGWLLLEPDGLADLGRTTLSALGFGSNWYFALTTDYFNEGLGQNFLLHSWSLAVEEQFYLIYPLVLIWLARSKQVLLAGLALIWALSFGAMLALPNEAGGFFATHLRVWELASGALLWVAMMGGFGHAVAPKLARWLGFSGLVLILLAAFLMPRAVWWPGALALVPVIGAALCIAFAWRGLEVRWLVGLGLISYALYLWHWPLLQALVVVFPRASDGAIATAVLVSIGVAWLAWRFVEEPVRRGRALAGCGTLLGVFGLVTLVLGLVGWQFHSREGMPDRFPADIAAIAATAPDSRRNLMDCANGLEHLTKQFGLPSIASETVPEVQVCRFGAKRHAIPEILYVGDSHLGAISGEIAARTAETGKSGALIALAACPPVPELVWTREGAERVRHCQTVQDLLLDLVATGLIKQTVLVGHWDVYVGETSSTDLDFDVSFARFVEAVSDQTELHVLLDVPTHDFDVPAALVRAKKWSWLGVPDWLTRAQHERVRAPYVKPMREAAARGQLILHDPVPAFCPVAVCLAQAGSGPLYYDASHVSQVGAAFLLDALPALPR